LEIIRDLNQLSNWRQAQAKAERNVAFVPTMGNLHNGHLNLVKAAKSRADQPSVLVSIFVNPMQFNDINDLARYPRTESEDIAQLTRLNVDAVFLPNEAELTPETNPFSIRVDPGELAAHWEGAARPGHFTGMATIVTKLFHLVQPQVAVFGEKDFQQLQIVRRMVRDLNMPIEIMGVPTARAEDGLALSSRNRFLDDDQRRIAPLLHSTLVDSAQQLRLGKPLDTVLENARTRLTAAGFKLDYLALCRPDTLDPQLTAESGILLAAARLGAIRLLDNQPVVIE
jgi:pantoate--beta-alanine ligase